MDPTTKYFARRRREQRRGHPTPMNPANYIAPPRWWQRLWWWIIRRKHG